MSYETFSRFASLIREVGPHQSLDARLLQALALGSEDAITAVFAPFDHTPTKARLAVVGITPGRVQAANALRSAGAALREGMSIAESARVAKLAASFSGGQTRNNLVAMLDVIGVGSRIGLASGAQLFDPASELVHFTSALRYPVFVDGGNYSGSPSMLRSRFLRSMVETYLAEEVVALRDCLWLPLGPKPTEALMHLVRTGLLRRERILDGMPHPSGLNGERVAAFLGKIPDGEASSKTDVGKLLTARARLTQQINSL